MNYFELQKVVFDFLLEKHNAGPGFTFSVRRKASKGAELNYFIGTEKSNYFSFTLWNIPCWYRGASTEVISYIIRPGDNMFNLYLEYFMARNQTDAQNQYNIEFGKILEQTMVAKGLNCIPSPPENKMYTYFYSFPKTINTVKDLQKAIEKFVADTQPIIQDAIDKTKRKFKDWTATKIDIETFNENIEKLRNRLEKHAYLHSAKGSEINIKKELKESSSEYGGPLNLILYGPPGTGKTYQTVLKAAEIIECRKILSYDEALIIFKKNLHSRIEFITFHQNYCYEDFIQGLRPEVDNKTSLSFDKKDGIFKKIADKALENIRLSEKDPDEISSEMLFDTALEEFRDEVQESEDKFPINNTAYIFEVEEDAFRYTGDKWINHAYGLRMKFGDLKEFYRNKVSSRKEIKKLNTISGLAIQHATYYYLVYKKILNHLPKKIDTPIKIEKKNYVFVIDEINRANISRVFG